MSSQIKMPKKKYTQNDLRRLMQEQKAKNIRRVVEAKIDSPLAKYNDQGQLTCILCKSVVRSESVWKVHINTKAHKAQVELARLMKDQLKSSLTLNQESHLKRPNPTQDSCKDSANQNKKLKLTQETVKEYKTNSVPSDFFDTIKSKANIENKAGTQLKAEDDSKEEVLPEGFFDDPIKDAKIRNLEYRDPQDEEWDRFQREIKEEASLSNAIIAGEQEEATAERQIKEIDEQMEKWSKVLDLEKKKEIMSHKLKDRSVKMEVDVDSDSGSDDENFDEFPDWRAKKFHR